MTRGTILRVPMIRTVETLNPKPKTLNPKPFGVGVYLRAMCPEGPPPKANPSFCNPMPAGWPLRTNLRRVYMGVM